MLLEAEPGFTEEDFRLTADLVYRHCGISLHDGKRELVRARLARRQRVLGYATAGEYLQFVRSAAGRGEFGHLIDAISTNLTSFFRERQHFDFLAETFLPDLLRRKRGQGGNRIRAWSAGCSTGEEPYTLAVTLLEALGGDGARGGWDVKVLATDISRDVLAAARRGTYEKAKADSIPPALREKYFVPVRAQGAAGAAGAAGDGGREAARRPDACRAGEALRTIVCFNYLNLMAPWPFRGPFDFIFCRNVMIYFDKPTQQSLVQRFWRCLEPGGLLFTGHSESLAGVAHEFQYVRPTIYAK